MDLVEIKKEIVLLTFVKDSKKNIVVDKFYVKKKIVFKISMC